MHAADDVGSNPAEPELGLWDAVSVIIGIVVGAGIYETAPLVFSNARSPAQAMLVWALGGVLSLIGATCYAELASTYPRSGGDYVYLTRAFAPAVGFLFGWAELVVLLTGSIAMMAYVFADYAVALSGLPDHKSFLFAVVAVVCLTLLNLTGVIVGKTAQNVLSGVKVVGLGMIVVAGLGWGSPRELAVRASSEESSIAVALIMVLYTYGGWNDAAFIAAEVRDRKRNLPRALVLGTGAVSALYLLVNAAFIAALGFVKARTSTAIAADVLSLPFGSVAGALMSLLVMISALSAANALIFTGSRVYAALGADYSVLAALGRWQPRLRSPIVALFAQLAVSLALISLVGTGFGRTIVDVPLKWAGLAPVAWAGHGGFDTLLRSTAPVFWLFFLLTGISLFVLRAKEPNRPRPFRVPLYPILPLVFCSTCLCMLYASIDYAGSLSLVGVIPVAFGLPLYFASKRKPASRSAPNTPVETPRHAT
jgi:basic amino acid/polyamine antiporter, APA family